MSGNLELNAGSAIEFDGRTWRGYEDIQNVDALYANIGQAVIAAAGRNCSPVITAAIEDNSSVVAIVSQERGIVGAVHAQDDSDGKLVAQMLRQFPALNTSRQDLTPSQAFIVSPHHSFTERIVNVLDALNLPPIHVRADNNDHVTAHCLLGRISIFDKLGETVSLPAPQQILGEPKTLQRVIWQLQQIHHDDPEDHGYSLKGEIIRTANSSTELLFKLKSHTEELKAQIDVESEIIKIKNVATKSDGRPVELAGLNNVRALLKSVQILGNITDCHKVTLPTGSSALDDLSALEQGFSFNTHSGQYEFLYN